MSPLFPQDCGQSGMGLKMTIVIPGPFDNILPEACEESVKP